MSTAKVNRRKQKEIQYFKKYTKPPKEEITYLDSGKVLYKGKDVTPAPLRDPAFVTYPSPALYILRPIDVPTLPPPTPLLEVDPSEWLNYSPPTEKESNGHHTPSQSSLSEDSGYEPLKADIDLEELAKEEVAEITPTVVKSEEAIKVKILDDEVYTKAEFKKIEDGKFVLILEETETIFFLEIDAPQMDTSLTAEENKATKPPKVQKRKHKKEKKEQIRKSTAQHETQTIPPLMIDQQVETCDLPLKDFSVTVTDSQIYDGIQEALQQDNRNAEKIRKCLFQRLYDKLMDPNGHFKNDLSYINFHLQIMDEELKKLPYDEQIKIICKFIRDYEEDPNIEELAEELENDYNGFIAEVRRVRDKLQPPKETVEGEEEEEEEPIVAVQKLELTPLPGYEPLMDYKEVKEILKSDEFANYLSPKLLSNEEQYQMILRSKAFKKALNILENIFTYQKEYDKLCRSKKIECIPEQPDVESMYNLDLLWEFQDEGARGKAVTCITCCIESPDILAIGYGEKGYVNSLLTPEKGLLLLWSLALPKDRPLRRLETNSSVISIRFHPESFYILALGLSSGDVVLVEIQEDISSVCSNVILQESHSFGHVYALEWFLPQLDQLVDEPKKKSNNKKNAEQVEKPSHKKNKKNYDKPQDGLDDESHSTALLADTYLVGGGRDSSLFTWKTSFGLLMSELVIKFPKICGQVKGIESNIPIPKMPMSVPPRPAVTCIEMHPKCRGHGKVEEKTDEIVLPEIHNVSAALDYDLSHLYLVATDDGSIHECYYRKMHYHDDFFRAHNGPVYCLSFNPFIDRLFLTCGGDWAVRIWCLGVGQPLITLSHDMEQVGTAHWSKHYSTIVASIKGGDLCIWDLARRTSSPVTTFANPNGHSYTSVTFSLDGLNVIAGDSGGNVYVYHLMDVPFMAKFPDQHLVNAIKKALVNKPEILHELEVIGAPFKTKE
ncbi:dynein axonemal intermediate chain 4-like [Ischnura elegans]|uniref:dynein axonemal intermediate chain 4-like n=1 Tax=Ischnura elegans TaxID=197161 RepID=UPI001ED89D8C|nr:dynein axonemal intermediate chain 4-like [Ischnura elegans]XP_046391340.1 dynein axonemal intermediate chain 4-like [Ischnura elegans]